MLLCEKYSYNRRTLVFVAIAIGVFICVDYISPMDVISVTG